MGALASWRTLIRDYLEVESAGMLAQHFDPVASLLLDTNFGARGTFVLMKRGDMRIRGPTKVLY